MSPKVFFDFTLPNATTWSLFSLLLAIALFFKFSRFLSMRNVDVLTFYLLVPGLLLLQESHQTETSRWLWVGYLCLLCGSAYLLGRRLFDLALVRRPSLSPNLNQGGLAWLAGTFAVCLISVAFRPPQQQGPAEQGSVGTKPPAVAEVEDFVAQRLKPVVHTEDRADMVGVSLALLCHLAVYTGLVFIACRHFQDMHAGLAAGTFYLLLPYTAIHIGQLHIVWPAAMIVWAVAAYRKPWISGLLLGVAAGSVYFPALLFPLWLSFYRGRGVGRFVVTFLLAAGLGLGIRVGWQAIRAGWPAGIENTFEAALVPWKQSFTEGFWHTLYGTSIHWAYRLPVFIVYVALLVVTAFWPNPKNLAHLIALTAALLIGVQFWYADQGGVYVLWYLPLLLLLAFRPNLVDRRPPVIPPDEDKLIRLRRAVGRSAARWLRGPEPTVKV